MRLLEDLSDVLLSKLGKHRCVGYTHCALCPSIHREDLRAESILPIIQAVMGFGKVLVGNAIAVPVASRAQT
jgi:hypothetical protein